MVYACLRFLWARTRVRQSKNVPVRPLHVGFTASAAKSAKNWQGPGGGDRHKVDSEVFPKYTQQLPQTMSQQTQIQVARPPKSAFQRAEGIESNSVQRRLDKGIKQIDAAAELNARHAVKKAGDDADVHAEAVKAKKAAYSYTRAKMDFNEFQMSAKTSAAVDAKKAEQAAKLAQAGAELL